jgi:hypothetical protein
VTVSLDPEARRALATARVLTTALALSCVLYALVAWLVRGQRQPLPPESRLLFTAVMIALAGMGILAAPFVRSAMIRRTDARGLPAWFVSVIVAQALREGAAVIGLVLSLLTGALWPALLCSLVAITAILQDFPRSEDLASHLRR